jgi:hypothetical protein
MKHSTFAQSKRIEEIQEQIERMAKMIKLGDKVTDKVTGFTGVAVAKTEWLYGCVRWGVQSNTLKDGKPIDCQWFDEKSLDVTASEPGGPMPDPSPKRSGE